MSQGFNHFFVFLHHFVSAKLATSSIRVRTTYVTLAEQCDPIVVSAEFLLHHLIRLDGVIQDVPVLCALGPYGICQFLRGSPCPALLELFP